jgi:hypothetical protein
MRPSACDRCGAEITRGLVKLRVVRGALAETWPKAERAVRPLRRGSGRLPGQRAALAAPRAAGRRDGAGAGKGGQGRAGRESGTMRGRTWGTTRGEPRGERWAPGRGSRARC